MKIPTKSITPSKIQIAERHIVKSVFVKNAYTVRIVTIPAVNKAAARTICFPSICLYATDAQAKATRIDSQITNVARHM